MPSDKGANYMLTIIDDFSKRVFPFFLKHKSGVFETFKKGMIMIEKKIGKQIKHLHTDNSLDVCFD